jgi:hypothetical protein
VSESPYFEQIADPVFCPSLLPISAVTNLQVLLSAQFWRDTYSLDFSTDDGFSEQELHGRNVVMNTQLNESAQRDSDDGMLLLGLLGVWQGWPDLYCKPCICRGPCSKGHPFQSF